MEELSKITENTFSSAVV